MAFAAWMNYRSRLFGALAGAVLVAAGLADLPGGVRAESAESVRLTDPTHTLVLRDGRELAIRLIEQTEDTLVAEVIVGGITAEQTYAMADVLTMIPLETGPSDAKTDSASDADYRVYAARLPGQFGFDITHVSIQKILKDAAKRDANVVVLYLDNDWLQAPFVLAERHDDEHNFDRSFFQVQSTMPVVTKGFENEDVWEERPQVVFWVNRAMGGLSFLPMTTTEVFFTEDGAMGGIGDLDSIFEGEADAFAKKQQGLRRTEVEGWLLEGGHHAEVGRAMMRERYVLSYRVRRGNVEFLEDYPSADPDGGWTLLTDDGEGDNEDTDAQIVRKQGNDTLTLRSEVALQLGFSRGTVDEIEDLLFELGIDETSIILDDQDGDGFSDRSVRIMDSYHDGVEQAQRDYQRAERDLAEINNPARRIAHLRKMISIIERYPEVWDPQEGLRINLRLQIEGLRNQIRLERAQRRGGGGG